MAAAAAAPPSASAKPPRRGGRPPSGILSSLPGAGADADEGEPPSASAKPTRRSGRPPSGGLSSLPGGSDADDMDGEEEPSGITHKQRAALRYLFRQRIDSEINKLKSKHKRYWPGAVAAAVLKTIENGTWVPALSSLEAAEAGAAARAKASAAAAEERLEAAARLDAYMTALGKRPDYFSAKPPPGEEVQRARLSLKDAESNLLTHNKAIKNAWPRCERKAMLEATMLEGIKQGRICKVLPKGPKRAKKAEEPEAEEPEAEEPEAEEPEDPLA
ncbi:hypothetical protein Rsub_10705 [Raphidocelis subcapitata]|uniref:Uncharacterized protein n=1 Tax=Raphidocelis subcapitata TaxID=307507 RepID=A0A2V0PMB8_9CHLO|nr:hypothetical protein Rsub_10705 [Raphidocelis subcapitata]|eukprot:GBF98205.1 hypothetical protein Rsub_10705 [Raphidocelis subcapitata]